MLLFSIDPAELPDDNLVYILAATALSKSEKEEMASGRLKTLNRIIANYKPETLYTVLAQKGPHGKGPVFMTEFKKTLSESGDDYLVSDSDGIMLLLYSVDFFMYT